MVKRRDFLLAGGPAALGLAGALRSSSAAAQEGKKPVGPYYEMFFLRLQMGDQVSRMLAWIENRAMPLFEKHGLGPMGFFNMNVGPFIPAVMGIMTYPSLTEMEAAWGKLHADPELRAAVAELEKDGPAYYREDTRLLLATPFSPPLKPAAVGAPAHKIFELRIYESPTERQLRYLHERFAGGEIDVFHKSGIHPVLYADTIFGPNRPNMAYLIPFDDLAHREKAWAAFGSNPDWVKIRDESIRKGGEIVRNITNMIFSPASFSMIR